MQLYCSVLKHYILEELFVMVFHTLTKPRRDDNILFSIKLNVEQLLQLEDIV